jgi:hypothetical protein
MPSLATVRRSPSARCASSERSAGSDESSLPERCREVTFFLTDSDTEHDRGPRHQCHRDQFLDRSNNRGIATATRVRPRAPNGTGRIALWGNRFSQGWSGTATIRSICELLRDPIGDSPKPIAHLRQCHQPPFHLLRVVSVARPNSGLEFVEASRLALDQARLFFALSVT